MAINFNTSNQTFRQLFGNGLTYSIPRFQRDYSWTSDEWDDLWQDIEVTLQEDGEPAHYMGYLVLQTRDNRVFEVIDGQQRLTTLSILTLAVLMALQDFVKAGVDAYDNTRRIEQLRNTYIGYLDPVTLIPRSKLTLNRNNDAYYKDYIVPLLKLPQRGLRSSEHLLRKAFEWFYRQVKDRYGAERKGTQLASFIDELSDKLFFTVITVTDELNAFKVFETLNSRGVRLSPTDLLKNYLFSVVYRESSHPNEVETLERRWEAMVGSLGGESFPDFLRVHWNSRQRFVRESELFKTIRSGTGDKAAVFDLIRSMEQDIGVYTALPSPEDELWTHDQRSFIKELRMFSVRQPWPLLVAAHRVLTPNDFAELLRACSVISFRYNVIGTLATNEQERVYNSVAQKTAEGELRNSSEIIRALASIYVSDSQFRPAFATKVLRTTASRNRHIVRFILFKLEKQNTGCDYDIQSEKYSVEHILPENPSAEWEGVTGVPESQIEDFTYRLGNMTLLDAKSNRSIGNRPFIEKRQVYEASEFSLTKTVAENNSEWNVDRIASRQTWMANQATAVWRIVQLS